MNHDIECLVEIFFAMKTKEEIRNLLYGILTPKELDEFATRLEIVRLLKQGVPQHTIAQKLKVGIATVTRGSREIKLGRFKYVKP